MAKTALFLSLVGTAAANQQITLSYPVSPGERITLQQVIFDSTGTFNMLDMRNSKGDHFTNASISNPIKSTQLSNTTDYTNYTPNHFFEPIVVAGGESLILDVKDTSGSSNTVSVMLAGYREYGVTS